MSQHPILRDCPVRQGRTTSVTSHGCQPHQLSPITRNQRVLLRSPPALDHPLVHECLMPRLKCLTPDELDRPTGGCIALEDAGLMPIKASIEIVRVPRVVASVRTAKHVRVESHLILQRTAGSSYEYLRMSGRQGSLRAPSGLLRSKESGSRSTPSLPLRPLLHPRRRCGPFCPWPTSRAFRSSPAVFRRRRCGRALRFRRPSPGCR